MGTMRQLSMQCRCQRDWTRALFILGLALWSAGCESPDGVIPPADTALATEVTTHREIGEAHQLVLADSEETGQRLLLIGQLVDRESGRPLPQRRVRLFHTNAEGSYEEAIPGDESTARLSGDLLSGPDGRFVLSTVFPGGYGSAEGSGGHIHTSIANATPEAYDIHFAPFAGAGLRRWAARSRQGVILDLYTMGDTLVATGRLPVGLPDTTDS